MRFVILLSLVASASFGQGRFDRFNQRTDQGRSHRGFLQSSGVSLANAPQPGDLAGAWWAMYGDGTMRSGSAVTLTATGSPTNTVENGWPVRTYTSAQNDQEPADVAFPASDFSVCKHHRSVNLAATYELMAFGTTATAAATAVLPFEQTITTGVVMSYTSNGAAYTSAGASSGSVVAGTWAVWCFTYQRVGGAANNVGTLYKDGVQVAQATNMNLVQALASRWSTNGGASGVLLGAASSTRGAFVTYKLLSAADVARITAAVAP